MSSRKSILLPREEREKLAKAAPPTKVECPECGGHALAARNGDWECVEGVRVKTRKVDPETGKPITRLVLTCHARGVLLPNGDLVPTQGRIMLGVAPRDKPRQTKAGRRARIRRNREERMAA